MINGNHSASPRFDPYSFGQRLQNARRSRGITQEELAEMLCVDRNHITRMERGVRACSIELLVDMSVALDVSIDYLLMGLTDGTATRQKLITIIEQLTQIAKTL